MTMEIQAAPSGVKMQPLLVNGYETARPTRNVVHEILGTGVKDVTLRPASPRTGTLRLVFLTEATALQALTQHSNANYFSMGDTDLTTIGMRYVVTGTVTSSLDDESRSIWLVEVPFQEIPRA
jgi:hypothetical protein